MAGNSLNEELHETLFKVIDLIVKTIHFAFTDIKFDLYWTKYIFSSCPASNIFGLSQMWLVHAHWKLHTQHIAPFDIVDIFLKER